MSEIRTKLAMSEKVNMTNCANETEIMDGNEKREEETDIARDKNGQNQINVNVTDVMDENGTNQVDENGTNEVDENESQNYLCTSCTKKFLTQSDLDRHWLWHVLQLEHMQSCCVNLNQLKVIKCDFCTSYYPDVAKLREHQKKHFNIRKKIEIYHTEKNITNKLFIKPFPAQSDIKNHVERHTLQSEHEADINSKKIYENETNKIDENKTSKITNNITEYIINEMDENEINKRNEDYRINMGKNKQDNMDDNKINEIDNDINNVNERNKMDENEMNGIANNATNKMCVTDSSKKYSCYMCSKTFVTQADLEKHSKKHIRELKYMQNCYVILNKIKIFKCDFCTSCFTDLKKLRTHQNKYFVKDHPQKNNKMDKPYTCEECGWGFMKKSTLDAHSILHQPFEHVCECGIGYYKKCDLDSHRRLVHPHYKPPPKPKTPPLKIKQETDDETEDEIEETEPEYRPHIKMGPRLKACLTFKQPDKRKLKRLKKGKPIKRERHKKEPKQKRVNNNTQLQIEPDENGKFVCSLCTRTFIAIDDFMLHLHRDHTTLIGDKYKCNFCNRTATCSSNLKIHMFTHAGYKPYVCSICKGRFSQAGALKLHLKRHTGDRKFPCKECDKTFYNSAEVRLHSRVHTGEKPFDCKQCKKSFSDPSAYRRHLLIHTGLKPYKCRTCPQAFCDPAALYRHTRRHEGFNVSCPICKRLLSSQAALRKHHILIHTELREEDMHVCDYCGSKFTMKSNLIAHIRHMHVNFYPQVECEICGQMYKNAEVLKIHVKQTHLKITRYECDVCGARFYHKCKMNLHKTQVHRRKWVCDTYECDYCHQTFYYKVNIIKHISVKHLGLVCQTCTKVFCSPANFKRHLVEGCTRCTVCNKPLPSPLKLKEHFIVCHLEKSEQQMYECDYCSKQFPLKSRLRSHIQDHVRPSDRFRCDHCSKAFPTKGEIMKHIWEKHMISLFCDNCLKMFHSESEFRQHKRAGDCRPHTRQHTCEICNKKVTHMRSHLLCHMPKQMECYTCGAKFNTKSTLTRHIRLVHKSKDLSTLKRIV